MISFAGLAIVFSGLLRALHSYSAAGPSLVLLPLGLIVNLGVGSAQALLLKRTLVRFQGGSWVMRTAIAGFLGGCLALGSLWIAIPWLHNGALNLGLSIHFTAPLLMGLGLGASLGIAQRPLFKSRLPRLSHWVFASLAGRVGGWLMVGLIISVYEGMAQTEFGDAPLTMGWFGLMGAMFGLLYGGTTGVVLQQLWQPKQTAPLVRER